MPLRLTNSTSTEVTIRQSAPKRSIPVIAMVLSGAILWLIAELALHTKSGLMMDNDAMNAVYAHSSVEAELLSALGLVSIGTALLAVLILVFLGLIRGKIRTAMGIIFLVGASNISAQILKHLVLTRPDTIDQLPNSLPSGHTTLIISLGISAIAVAPASFKYLAVFAASLLGTATGASTVVAGWHRPADVFAALALAFFFASLVTFLLRWKNSYRPGNTASAALAGALVAGLILVVIGVRPTGGWSGFSDAALVLSAMGAATAFTMAVFARMISPQP